MNAQKSKLTQWTRLLLVLPVGLSGYAQGTLIGPSTLNGSFEDGILAPWRSGHDVQVLDDPAFASDGDYYASFQSSAVLPVLAGQNLQPEPGDGLTFMLSFDARVGIPGLDMVSLFMSARTPEGASLSASLIPITAPPLSASAWHSYEYQLLMPGAWGASGVTFGISFSNKQPLGGVTHYAYLDNVVLQQIPEPSVFALFGLSAFLWAAGLLRSRRNAFGT
jgi:hypothetical protein